MATLPLRQQRCWNHQSREAVSRCPDCRRPFCRECVTELDGRLICATCLQRITAVATPTGNRWRLLASLWPVLGLCGGLVLSWWVFFSIGRLLVALPSSFHGGGTTP